MDGKKLVPPSSIWAWMWRWIGLLLIAVLLASGSTVDARAPEPKVMPIPAVDKLVVEEEVRRSAEFNPKLDSALNQLLEVQRTDGMAGARAFAETRQMVLEGDRVQVILVTEPAAIPGLAQAIEGLGGETQGAYKGLLQALVPIDALEPLADRSEVQLIREPRRAIELELPEAGSATTEGVAASNATAWHSAGHDGTGVRVAVINGGFTGYSTLLGSDLPSSVGTYDWTGFGMGGSEHGTACAEIAHDMAPGATMDLHKVSTVVELDQAVTQAIADGVDVISMSLGWPLDGPGDGTGDLANIVNGARSNGIFYATAAGNDAEVTWAGTYHDYYMSANDMHLHAWDGASMWYNFMGPGTGTCIVFPAGTRLTAGLHWDDWSAVDQDYDLHLARWPGSGGLILVTSSTNPQNGGASQTPQEYISLTAAGGNCYAWLVERVNSNRDVCFRLSAPKTVHLDKWTVARSVTFPADSPDAITVGAVDVNSPYPLEPYSSQGPTFGPGGVCSGGATKPDIASYANVSTVSYGPGDFAGTSAATPHVAGAAALVRQRYPGYSVTQLQNYLENEAIDLGTPGKDNLYGSGRLYLPIPAPVVISITPNSGEDAGVVHITDLAGSNFQPGATVKLAKTGETDIDASSVVVVDSAQITCDFDLTGAATGAWVVVVTNPDAQSGTLPGGFTVYSSVSSNLSPGWNLISLQLEPLDPAPEEVLSSIAGEYDEAFAYEGCDSIDPWKQYSPGGGGNDLPAMDVEHGYWVHTTSSVTLILTGTLPTSVAIPLCTGWNLVGYPSQTARPVVEALSSIDGCYTQVQTFDATDPADPWKQYDLGVPAYANDLTMMEPGRGYWIYATEPCTLSITPRKGR